MVMLAQAPELDGVTRPVSFSRRFYSYTAFGTTYVPATQISEGLTQRYTFQGREAAANAGAPMFYRNRMYSAGLGRFGRRDLWVGGDDLYNVYCFPGDNATMHGDWNGNGEPPKPPSGPPLPQPGEATSVPDKDHRFVMSVPQPDGSTKKQAVSEDYAKKLRAYQEKQQGAQEAARDAGQAAQPAQLTPEEQYGEFQKQLERDNLPGALATLALFKAAQKSADSDYLRVIAQYGIDAKKIFIPMVIQTMKGAQFEAQIPVGAVLPEGSQKIAVTVKAMREEWEQDVIFPVISGLGTERSPDRGVKVPLLKEKNSRPSTKISSLIRFLQPKLIIEQWDINGNPVGKPQIDDILGASREGDFPGYHETWKGISIYPDTCKLQVRLEAGGVEMQRRTHQCQARNK